VFSAFRTDPRGSELPASPFFDDARSSSSSNREFVEYVGAFYWRTGRDSNPRTAFTVTHFPGVRLQPLGHLSALEKGRYTGPTTAARPVKKSRTKGFFLWVGIAKKHAFSMFFVLASLGSLAALVPKIGWRRFCRTLERLSPLHTFQAYAFKHSATCPHRKKGRYTGRPSPQGLLKLPPQKAFPPVNRPGAERPSNHAGPSRLRRYNPPPRRTGTSG
jgi:hypothetical protein